MPSTIHINTAWLISLTISTFFALGYPLVVAAVVQRRFHVSWRYFGYGALIFFLFQIISRVPLVTILGNVLAPQLKAPVALLIWTILLALTAGLVEEVGRYVGYRWLMGKEEKTWSKAVMYGVGHGGIESILLVGGIDLLTLINVLVLSATNLTGLPESQHAQVIQQLNAINASPAWAPLLGGWERLWTLPVHVSLSVVVLQVFQRRNLVWLWVAVLAHAIFDFVLVELLQLLGRNITSFLIVEGIAACFGLVALWIIWRLRTPESENSALSGQNQEAEIESSPTV